MLHFIKSFMIFLEMYNRGFWFSKNTTRDRSYKGEHGFYRFNHTLRPGHVKIRVKDMPTTGGYRVADKTVSSSFDIDFSTRPGGISYFHVHGDDFRWQRFKVKE